MNYVEMFRQGMSMEEVLLEASKLITEAQTQYEEEKVRIEKERAEKEYKELRLKIAKDALGAALVEYYEALGVEITEQRLAHISDLIELLPRMQIRVSKGWL